MRFLTQHFVKENFIKDIFGGGTGGVVRALFDPGDLAGTRAAEEAKRAAGTQVDFGQQAITSLEGARQTGIDAVTGAEESALGFFDPFSQVGADVAQQGLGQLEALPEFEALPDLEFLGDPQAQFDFLQQNPLFQLALENANRKTGARAASVGRLDSGDTLEQLSNNVLLSATPLIDRQRQDLLNIRQDQTNQRGIQRQDQFNERGIQRQDLFNQLGFGADIAARQAQIPQTAATNIANISTGVGTSIADLLTQIGATTAGGIVGAQNARSQGGENIASLGGTFFSDPRLKENKTKIGNKNGYSIWHWNWNKIANELFGLYGRSEGVMFTEVLEKNPEATSYQNGYGKVNYQMIGI